MSHTPSRMHDWSYAELMAFKSLQPSQQEQLFGKNKTAYLSRGRNKAINSFADDPLAAFSRRESRFLELFRHGPILEFLGRYLHIGTIVALTRTCRALSFLYRFLLTRHWDIDTLLSRYVDDPKSFRVHMGRHHALISGSLALQYFGRLHWDDTDMNVYVRKGEDAEAFIQYLCIVEGYQLDLVVRRGIPEMMWETYDAFDIQPFVRQKGPVKTRITISRTEALPLKSIVQGSFTSATVNFLAWNKAYSLFPSPTFVHNKTYMLCPMNEENGNAIARYNKRGWKSQDVMWPEERARPHHPFQTRRRIVDRYSWTITYGDRVHINDPIPDYVIESSGFDIVKEDPVSPRFAGTHRPLGYYVLSAGSFSAPILQYEYLLSSLPLMDWLETRTYRLTLLELFKIPEHLRPAGFREFWRNPSHARYSKHIIHRPKRWTYYDDDMPQWIEEFDMRWGKIDDGYRLREYGADLREAFFADIHS